MAATWTWKSLLFFPTRKPKGAEAMMLEIRVNYYSVTILYIFTSYLSYERAIIYILIF